MEKTSLPFDFSSSFFNPAARLLDLLAIPQALRSEGEVQRLARVISVQLTQDIPFLSSFKGTTQLHDLAREFTLFTCSKGETIFKQGAVAISTEESLESEVAVSNGLTELKAGQYFGELGLLKDSPRTATATARENSKMMTVTRATYERVLQSISALAKVPVGRLNELVIAARMRSFQGEDLIVKQGDLSSWIYFIVAGYVKVIRKVMIPVENSARSAGLSQREESIMIDELEVGDLFGDVAALTRQPLQYSVLTLGSVTCFCVDKDEILRLDPEHVHAFRKTCKPYPSDEVLVREYLRTQRWDLYKAEVVANAHKEKRLRIQNSEELRRSPEVLPKKNVTVAKFDVL